MTTPTPPFITYLEHEVELSSDPIDDGLLTENDGFAPLMRAGETEEDETDEHGIHKDTDKHLKGRRRRRKKKRD